MPHSATASPGSNDSLRRFDSACLLIGFALGGFFDGILLHQVLQWHHLLSGLDGAAFRDLRVQILADGLFHALMYVICVLGLWLLWRAHRTSTAVPRGRRLLAGLLIGFGVWHVLDGVLSHWILAIHRIRMDSEVPLVWDLLWFFAFGAAFVAAGLALRRRNAGRDDVRGAGRTALSVLTLTVLAAGFGASLPPAGATTLMVMMRPDATANELLEGLTRIGGGIVWADPSGALWAVDVRTPRDAAQLYRHGALLVTGSPVALGCLAWTRVAENVPEKEKARRVAGLRVWLGG